MFIQNILWICLKWKVQKKSKLVETEKKISTKRVVKVKMVLAISYSHNSVVAKFFINKVGLTPSPDTKVVKFFKGVSMFNISSSFSVLLENKPWHNTFLLAMLLVKDDGQKSDAGINQTKKLRHLPPCEHIATLMILMKVVPLSSGLAGFIAELQIFWDTHQWLTMKFLYIFTARDLFRPHF